MRALHGYLYAGVTTVFDAGNRPDFIFHLRERERAGRLVSPRIFATGGTVASPGGHGGPYNVEAWPQDRKLLDEHLATKPDLAKIGQDEHGWGTRPLITQLPTICSRRSSATTTQGRPRRSSTCPTNTTRIEAIYAGVDTLAHPVIQAPGQRRLHEADGDQARADGLHADHRRKLQPAGRASRVPRPAALPRHASRPSERQRLKTEESRSQKENRWAGG